MRASFPSTKDVPRLSIKIAALCLVTVVVYVGLVLCDYVLPRYRAHLSQQINADAIARENATLHEDRKEISRLRQNGFQSLHIPAEFGESDYADLVSKYGIAPLAPQPNTRIAYCNEGYGLITYNSDRFGFRNKNEVWDTEKVDVVLIGDSFAQGACVSDAKTIASSLSTPQGSVLNLGTSGNSPIHYAALSKIFIKPLRPRFVVVMFYANDNIDEQNSVYYKIFFAKETKYFEALNLRGFPSKQSSSLTAFHERAIGLQNGQVVSHKQTKNVVERVSRFLTLSNMRELFFEWTSRHSQRLPFSTKLAIDETMKQCLDVNCVPLFVYIPNSGYWRPDMRAKPYRDSIKSYLAEARSRPLFLDTSSVIEKMGATAYAPRGPHLSEEGYAVVARAIQQTLIPP